MSKVKYFRDGSVLAIALSVLASGQALAQADLQKAFADADKDKNGRLDAAEFATLPQAIRDHATDANGDGFYVLAELQPTQGASDATEVRAVVSVGTYLKSGAEDTALNIEATSRDDLLKSGSPTISDIIRNMTEASFNYTGDNRGQNADGYGVKTLSLRSLGSGRTLVLFDGVRLADDPATNGGQTAAGNNPNVTGGGSQNLANIPMEVLASVEVLKDGGSAAYGGDAAGGALNFTPRRDLNGFEATVSYKYIRDTDGDYDANIQWGKRRGTENFLFSAFYSHQSPLSGRDRDFIDRPFAATQFGVFANWANDYRALSFAAPGPVTSSTSNPFTAGGFGLANPLYVSSPGVINPIQDPERGTLRDDLCLELGGSRAFGVPHVPLSGNQAATANVGILQFSEPTCAYPRHLLGLEKEDTDVYRVFTDATVNVTDNIRWHSSMTFSKTQTTVVDMGIQESNACDPWPTNAPSFTTATTGNGTTPSRQCTDSQISNINRAVFNTTSAGTQSGPTVPGYNPAVRDYLLRYYANSPLGSTTNGARVFTDAQINQVTGCTTLSTVSNTYVTSTVANGFNCTFASDTGVLTGRTYWINPTQTPGTGTNAAQILANTLALQAVAIAGMFAPGGNQFGTVTNGFFTPGTAQVQINGSGTNASTQLGAVTVLGPTLGQGYTPTQGVTGITFNAGASTAAPINFGLSLNPAFQTNTSNPLNNPLFDADASTTSNPVVGMGSGLPGQYGKVLLPNATYGPFVDMYNTAFKDHQKGFFNSQIASLIVSQDIKGDLGEHFGNALDFTVRGRYQRQINRTVGSQAMTDRFQRALNGFATDVNDLGADGLGCSVAETLGTRVVQVAPGVLYAVTGVPYTVGAGGGGDYDPLTGGTQRAEFGFNPGANAGNRCFFFNPFASAVRVSKLNHAQIVADNGTAGFVGANTPSAAGTSSGPGTIVGATGDYQGYGYNMGLENSPGVLRWIFQQREIRSMSDQILVQGILNGQFTKFELPGGPIDWDVVLQYGYQDRDAFSSPLGDRNINPCPFMRTSVPRYSALNNIVNATSTCSGQPGLFANQNVNSNGTGFGPAPTGGGYRTNYTHAAVVEFNLPFIEQALLHNTIRYEEAKGVNDNAFRGSTIYSTDLKWQAFDNLAFTGNISMNFDEPAIQEDGSTLTFARDTSPTNAWYTGVNREVVNTASQSITFVNTQLGPEHGTNYSIGAIFQTRDRASQVRVTYFNDRVGGAPVNGVDRNSIGRALTHNRVRGSDLDVLEVIDCNDPTLAPFFRDGAANGLFNGAPFVRFTNGVDFYNCGDNSVRGGPTIGTFTLAGVDTDNDGSALGNADLGLAIDVPDQVNGGASLRSGIELGANHRVKRMVYGGNVTLTGDVTWNLRNESAPTFAYGAFIAEGVSTIGNLQLTANFSNIWAGSVGANYQHGKHNVRLNLRWQGGVFDSNLGLAIEGDPPTTRNNNVNPIDTTRCDTAASGLAFTFLPRPHSAAQIQEAVGDILVGEGAYDPNCLLGDYKGYRIHGQALTSLAYRVELPAETTMTVSIDNLLDTPPAFRRFMGNYNPFTMVSAEGRTVKVQVQKKF